MSKGGGSGGGSTTTVQKADPWVGLQPALSQLYGSALSNYQSGGPQYYPNSTLAGTNGQIETALNQGWNTTSNNLGELDRAKWGLQRTADGLTPWDNPAYGSLQNASSGGNIGTNPAEGLLRWFGYGGGVGNNAAQGALQGMATGTGPANPAMGTLQDMSGNSGTFGQFSNGSFMGGNTANPYLTDEANGKYLTDQTNPYLRGLFDNASGAITDQFKNAIAPGLASQFSAAGRTGSGAAMGAFDNASNTLGRTLTNTANSIYGGAYENERQRQQQAISMLSGNYNTERGMQLQGAAGQAGVAGQLGSLFQGQQGQQLGAASALANLGLQERGQQLQGAQSLASLNEQERAQQLQAMQTQTNQYGLERGLQQQAQLSVPQMQAAQQNNLSQLLGIGQYRQGQQQDQINADMARWNFGQNAPTANLQTLNQLLQGGSAYSGQQSTSNQSLNRNPFASALGGASAAYGIGSALGTGSELGGMIGGPWGLLGGALLGGLFG